MQLITKDIAKKLHKADQEWLAQQEGKWGKESTRTPDAVIVKFFTPWAGATWWIVQATPLDSEGQPCEPEDAKDWHMFGFCDLGDRQCAELGYTLLSQLQEIKGPWGLRIERDRNYSGSLAEIQSRYR